ncbi:hypothetical protein VC83_07406 [Pseudogymnoascus destructans]|uniref:Uncharacterized protein n=2 Tax=Pseudogymnoascus destructans TaxID=655981 RepID=L8G7V0_PSED2|nr:uncharacterized protein VC83_07406 [Pseudogymnoascus destructans]ELR08718.1 hypothetical protein GMDG_03400 [Pseudogymnoascus destructans 20631-21]OAF56142.1 hypothetical protein VC83_07406 [Pseudogymnoascus destructans]
MAEESLLDSDAPGNIRSPLIPHTNTKPVTITAKSAKKVSRKSSFARRLDSSESIPSSHGSIFAAEYVSPHASEDGGFKIEKWQAIGSSVRPSTTEEQPPPLLGVDENSDVGLPVGNTPILYGHGTALTTIIEQKSSMATIRTISTPSPVRTLTRPRSTSDLSSSSASASILKQPPKASPIRGEFSISGMIHRLASFSDEDVGTIKLSWPEGYNPIANKPKWAAKSSIDCGTSEMQEIVFREIYAQPLSPIEPPIERPATPPGMPSWTAAQQQRRPRAVSSTPARTGGFQRATARVQLFFGYEPLSRAGNRASGLAHGHGLCGPWDMVPSRRRCVSVPNTAVSGAPRFRPPRSGHGVTSLELHPFARAEARPTTARTQEATTTGRRISSAPMTTGGSRSSRRSSEPVPARPVKPKGKRKPGQRVRFISSTAVVATASQAQADGPNTERRRAIFPQPCRHRRVKTCDLPPQEITPSTVAGEISAPQTLPHALPAGSLENHPDHLPSLLLVPAASGQEPDGSTEPSSEPSLKSKKGECWKCRVKTAMAQVNDVLESCTMLCC